MGAPRTPVARSTAANSTSCVFGVGSFGGLLANVKRMSRLAGTLAPVGAIPAVCAGAVPVGAAETSPLAQQWDPVPWVIFASCLVIAALAAADAKADRRGH